MADANSVKKLQNQESAVQLEVRGPPLSVTDRYYTKYYAVDVNGHSGEDQCVLQHSNRICVVCVAPSHVLFEPAPGLEILSVDFHFGRTDRTKNQVSGKGKSGQKLNLNSPLCKVTCKGEKSFVLYSCIKGFLVEINENLITQPGLLKSKSMSEGYIAIVMPKHENVDTVCNHLLPEEEYQLICQQRSTKGESVDC